MTRYLSYQRALICTWVIALVPMGCRLEAGRSVKPEVETKNEGGSDTSDARTGSRAGRCRLCQPNTRYLASLGQKTRQRREMRQAIRSESVSIDSKRDYAASAESALSLVLQQNGQ